jgi:hypothetical protein
MQLTIGGNSSIDWQNAVVTLLAVILGAMLAYLATHISERKKSRREDYVKGALLTIKVHRIVDGIFRLDRQLYQGIENAKNAGVAGPPWAQFENIASIDTYQENMATEDLAILAVSNGYDLIQNISETAEGYNSIIKAIAHIFDLREQLAEAMPPNQIDGRVVSFEGVPSPEARMLLINLDTLSQSVLHSLNELKSDAISIGPALHRHLKKTLKVKSFPSIALPNASPSEPPVAEVKPNPRSA